LAHLNSSLFAFHFILGTVTQPVSIYSIFLESRYLPKNGKQTGHPLPLKPDQAKNSLMLLRFNVNITLKYTPSSRKRSRNSSDIHNIRRPVHSSRLRETRIVIVWIKKLVYGIVAKKY